MTGDPGGADSSGGGPAPPPASPAPLACAACGADVPLRHPYSWCSACGAPLPAEVKAQLSNPYTQPMSPSFTSLREDTVPDEDAVRQAIDEMLAPPPPNRMALVLTASVVLFALAAAVGGASLSSIVGLVAVLFVHESGHYLAMRAFGYQNVRMFFIPFLGAAVSSPSTHLAAWKEGVVLLAGPLPGIVAGLLAMLAGVVTGASWWREVAEVAIFVNAFNLLPLEPLDGGQLLRLTVFGRWRHAETAFRIVTGLALGGFALWSGAWLLALFAASLVFAVRLRHRVLAAAARLRADHPAMSRDLQTLGPDQRRVLYAYALDALPPEDQKTATTVAGTDAGAAGGAASGTGAGGQPGVAVHLGRSPGHSPLPVSSCWPCRRPIGQSGRVRTCW